MLRRFNHAGKGVAWAKRGLWNLRFGYLRGEWMGWVWWRSLGEIGFVGGGMDGSLGIQYMGKGREALERM